MIEGDPAWRDELKRDEHFRKHRRGLRLRTIADYDRSSIETIRDGIRFEYFDPTSAKWRVGYFDRPNRRFTALSDDESEIVAHFRASESYARSLVGSTYPY